LLDRINKELGGNFDLAKFEHTAVFVEDEGYIKMFLRSLEDQQVRIDKLDATVQFKNGELIHTEVTLLKIHANF
jgi:uncharacterized SAM-dependent methyltransferase